MVDFNGIEENLNRLKNRIGLVGGALRFTPTTDGSQDIVAYIDQRDWHIELYVNQNFNPVNNRAARKYARKKNITAPLEKICSDVVYHECGHWELPRTSGNGCPYSAVHVFRIREGVHKALKDKKIDPKLPLEMAGAIITLEDYMQNIFQDIINNTNCRNYTSNSGIVLYWHHLGWTLPEKKFTNLFEAFVRLNMYCWGDSIDKQLLQHSYRSESNTINAVQNILRQMDLKRDRSWNMQVLFNKNYWQDAAYLVTRELAVLFKAEQENSKAQSKGSMKVSDDEQDGNQQKDSDMQSNEPAKDSANQSGHGQNLPVLSPSPITKSGVELSLELTETRENVVYEQYKAGTGMASHMTSFEQLDLLYRRIAKDITIVVDRKKDMFQLPISPYGRREFIPEKHDNRRQKIRSVSVNINGEISFRIAKGHIMQEEGYIRHAAKFPEYLITLLDTSQSMSNNPEQGEHVGDTSFIPWGDNSKYHYALKGWYGIQNFLQKKGYLRYVEQILVNFSGATLVANQKKSPRALRKLALTPQFGDTVPVMATIKKQLVPEAFIISLSDGMWGNWYRIRDEFRKSIIPEQLVHIQIGGEQELTKDLQEWGVQVYHVKGNNDLSQLMMRITEERYTLANRT
jgi:hypothetical protein